MNPIKSSDIFKDDGTLDSLLKKLERIETVIASLVNTAKKLNTETSSLNVTSSKDNEILAKKAKETDLVAREMEKYLKALDETNVKVQAVKNATNDANKAAKLEADIKRAQFTSLNNYNAQLKLAKQRYDQLTESEKENTKEGKKLESQITRLTSRINEQKKAQKDSIRERELELKVNKSAEGSYNKLSAQYSLLKIRLNAMSAETRKFTAEGQRMEAQAKALYQEMNELQKATGKNQLNVGNYGSALNDLNPALGGVVGGVQRVSAAFKALLANPIVLALAAIVGAVSLLVKSLKRSEEGQAAWNKVMRVAGSIMDNFLDIVTLTATAILNFGKGFDEVIAKLRGFRKEVQDDIKAAKELADLESEFNQREREAIKDIARARLESEKARAEAEELKFKNAEEAIRLLKESFDKEQEIIEIQKRQAADKIRILKAESALASDDIAAKKAIAEATANLIELQASYNSKIRERTRFLNQFNREALKQFLEIQKAQEDLDKQQIEVLIEQNNRALQEENLHYAERIAILKNNKDLELKILENQYNNEVKLIDERLDKDQISYETAIKLNQLLQQEYFILASKVEDAFNRTREALDATLIKNEIAELESELSRFSEDAFEDFDFKSKPKRNIFDFLGISVDDQDAYKSELKSALDFAKGQLLEFAALQTKLAEQRVQDSQNTVNALENELQTQIELARLGYANRVADVQRQLQLEKKAQDEALAERKKAQQQQLAIQTIEQASSLATAAAKLWSQFQLGAIPLIALMFGSFTAAKIKSFQIAKEEFSEGMFEKIGGGSHASGNDTFIGMTNSGKAGYAERGEGHAVFNKRAMDKYGDHIQDFVHGVNKGHFGELFKNTGEYSKDNEKVQQSADMSVAEGELKRIREQGEHKLASGAGMIIEKYKSVTRYYR